MLAEVIGEALAGVALAVPEAAGTMVCGASRGTAVFCSSNDVSGEPASADGPAEKRRVVVSRADFPTLSKGGLVYVGQSAFLVTSVKEDPMGATATVGLSDSLGHKLAEIRRAGTAIRQPAKVLAVESDVLDAWGDNVAPTTCRAWFVVVSAEDWREDGDPQIGDEVTMEGTRTRVASVARHDGWWTFACRARR